MSLTITNQYKTKAYYFYGLKNINFYLENMTSILYVYITLEF